MSCHWWSKDDVYVFRATVSGVLIRDARDLLPFVKAFGTDQNLRVDVRGAGLWVDGNGKTVIDLVGTAESGFAVPLLSDSAASIADKLMLDKELRAQFPSLKLENPVFGVIIAPNDAIAHWQALPVLWDHAQGGTASFAQPSEYSLFLGKADDGAKVVPMPLPFPGLGPVPGQNVPGQPKPKPGSPEADVVPWLLGAAGLGLLGVAGWKFLERKR
jgi:hypothetical protein